VSPESIMDPKQRKEVREIVQHLFTNIVKHAHSKWDSQQTRPHDDHLFYNSHRVPLFNPCLWGGIQSTGTIPHATWTLTVSAVRAILCCKNAVVKPKVWIQMLVLSDLKMDARKGHFWNGCTQGSFCALMRANRKAILTDARNGLLGNGCAQGMEQIPDARNLHPRCTQPL